jgi:hypothetical protein
LASATQARTERRTRPEISAKVASVVAAVCDCRVFFGFPRPNGGRRPPLQVFTEISTRVGTIIAMPRWQTGRFALPVFGALPECAHRLEIGAEARKATKNPAVIDRRVKNLAAVSSR